MHQVKMKFIYLIQGCDRLSEAVLSIEVNADVRTVIDQKGTGPNQPEQILCDYYVSACCG